MKRGSDDDEPSPKRRRADSPPDIDPSAGGEQELQDQEAEQVAGSIENVRQYDTPPLTPETDPQTLYHMDSDILNMFSSAGQSFFGKRWKQLDEGLDIGEEATIGESDKPGCPLAPDELEFLQNLPQRTQASELMIFESPSCKFTNIHGWKMIDSCAYDMLYQVEAQEKSNKEMKNVKLAVKLLRVKKGDIEYGIDHIKYLFRDMTAIITLLSGDDGRHENIVDIQEFVIFPTKFIQKFLPPKDDDEQADMAEEDQAELYWGENWPDELVQMKASGVAQDFAEIRHIPSLGLIFMELCDGSVRKLIDSPDTRTQVTARVCKRIVLHVAKAIKHLHDRRIAHQDIHTGNVLYVTAESDSNKQITEEVMLRMTFKLADFGESTHFELDVEDKFIFGKQADLRELGQHVAHLCLHRTEDSENCVQCDGDREAKQLFDMCTNYSPIEDILAHSWLANQ